jgi:lipoprotein-releasing system permease protein
VKTGFELFVALRYLRARRKQAVISVITLISILGVTAGTSALVIALSITNGFRKTLQGNLLVATAHISIQQKEPTYGIENWRELIPKLRGVPHVTSAAPALYATVLFQGPLTGEGGILKGIDPTSEQQQSDVLRHLKQGSVEALNTADRFPGVIVGSKLAQATGMVMGKTFKVLSSKPELAGPMMRFMPYPMRVAGLFESGFYQMDAQWAYASLRTVQGVLGVEDVVNAIEIKLDDVDRAAEVAAQLKPIIGPALVATTWMEQNRPVLNALRVEKIVTIITIGLIQLVAALNILIALVMMVMEKYRDIAILMSMGARRQQIRKIFVLQGVIIGVIGTVAGLALGYSVSYLADKYHWIPLNEEVYSFSYVPFDPRWTDSLWIAAVAIGVSFLATLYPARNATRIAPVEALRYE